MSSSSLLPLLLCAGLALPAAAQSWQKHHVSAGLGISMPRAELQPLYSNAVAWSFGYGYRFVRNFQFDVALDTGYNAANVRDFLDTSFGPLRIRDFQFFLPVGGRAVIPLARGRFQIYGGGGWAYLRYSERLRQPGDYVRLDCPACGARDGFGWYAQVGADVALDRGQMFRLGVASRIYDAHTEGAPIGQLIPVRTNDRWANSFLTLTVSF